MYQLSRYFSKTPPHDLFGMWNLTCIFWWKYSIENMYGLKNLIQFCIYCPFWNSSRRLLFSQIYVHIFIVSSILRSTFEHSKLMSASHKFFYYKDFLIIPFKIILITIWDPIYLKVFLFASVSYQFHMLVFIKFHLPHFKGTWRRLNIDKMNKEKTCNVI